MKSQALPILSPLDRAIQELPVSPGARQLAAHLIGADRGVHHLAAHFDLGERAVKNRLRELERLGVVATIQGWVGGYGLRKDWRARFEPAGAGLPAELQTGLRAGFFASSPLGAP